MQRTDISHHALATPDLRAAARVQPRLCRRHEGEFRGGVGQREQRFDVALDVEEIERTCRFAPLFGNGAAASDTGDSRDFARAFRTGDVRSADFE